MIFREQKTSWRSTADLDTKELTTAIDRFRNYSSKEAGIYLPEPSDLAKGLYSEIKDKVKSSGAHYFKSIYVMLSDGTMANLQMKGAVVQEWGEFTKKTRNRLPDEWVEISSFEERKKGATKYNVPIFKFKQSLTEDESKKADEVFDILEEYLRSYLKQDPEKVDDIETIDAEVVNPEPTNDLPF